MAVFELKAEIAADSVAAWAGRLAEAEDLRLLVLEDEPSGRAWLVGYFDSQADAEAAWARLRLPPGPEPAPSTPGLRELADADWGGSYRAHFKRWCFGSLHWVPEWERESFPVPADGRVLWLDPGMAFGTGNHETTRLCCERLVEFANDRGVSGRVVDAGCGSGILALSAGRLGFARVAAFDDDPVAVAVSRENAVRNGLDGMVEFFTGDLAAGLFRRQAELVLANIQADILMRFAPDLCGALAPGGQLVLSGILERELVQVRAAFAGVAPQAPMDSRVLGEWSDLVLTRPV